MLMVNDFWLKGVIANLGRIVIENMFETVPTKA